MFCWSHRGRERLNGTVQCMQWGVFVILLKWLTIYTANRQSAECFVSAQSSSHPHCSRAAAVSGHGANTRMKWTTTTTRCIVPKKRSPRITRRRTVTGSWTAARIEAQKFVLGFILVSSAGHWWCGWWSPSTYCAALVVGEDADDYYIVCDVYNQQIIKMCINNKTVDQRNDDDD